MKKFFYKIKIFFRLQEILETYKLLAPPTLTLNQSNHTCNVLALFQCIAAHTETRPHFLNAQIPIFLYPFLNTLNKNNKSKTINLHLFNN